MNISKDHSAEEATEAFAGGASPSNSSTKLGRVQLEKSAPSSDYTQCYVLPAGGMHLAVPDLKFHVDHFSSLSDVENEEQTVVNSDADASYKGKNSQSKRDSQKGSKLPFGLELTAGLGLKSKAGEKMAKRAPPPSQTLFESATLLKSYFTFSQDKEPPDKSEATNEYEESVKNKVMGFWHTMKYGWSANLETKFSRLTPIYLLGKVYHKTFKEEQVYEGTGFLCSNIEGFKKDFSSIGWFTYRRKFPPLPESCLTSDCGWGCMIRSGQMMMFTALTRHFLPPGWRFQSIDDGPQASIHKQLVKLFCDDPSPYCPFSLHNLILSGHKMNKKAGNWYGPSCVAHMFKDAVVEGSKFIPSLNKISIYVAQDGAVYVQDILDMCSGGECLCRKSNVRTSSMSENGFNSKRGDSFSRSSVTNLSDKKRDSPRVKSRLKSDSFSSDCDKSSLGSWVACDESFEELSATPLRDNVPLDLFVDDNRANYKGQQKTTFGDAIASRVSEDVPSVAPAEEQSPCDECHGWKSCVIFIPVRLGGSTVNPIYHSCILSLFFHDLCIGIIGGRPKHSLYFVGFQENSLIHLDPHLSQDAVPLQSDFPLPSYHCQSPRKISISKMDPSATIGFYCHTRSQFFRLLEEAPMMATAKDGNLDSPIFEFIDGRSEDLNGWFDHSISEETARMSFSSSPPATSLPNSVDDTGAIFEESEELAFD